MLLGDFNVPYIDWVNRVPEPRARKIEKDFLESITDNLMYQHVMEHTRIRGPQKSTLDLILTKEEEDIQKYRSTCACW